MNTVKVIPTMKDEVVCRVYGKDKRFSTRIEAIYFFRECIEGSEGAERDRYCNIFFQLMDGQCFCIDEMSL